VGETYQQEAASATGSGSQSSYALAHHSKASNLSSYSVPSSQAIVRVMATGKHQLSDNNTYADEVGRGTVLDNDECEGLEYEEAYNSPLKGKQWANNNICSISSFLCQYLSFCRASL
jgi:hypothetical protein